MRFILVILISLLVLAGCQKPAKPPPSVRESFQLSVVTVNGPTTYYVTGSDEYAGFEYDLARLFARDLSATLGREVKLNIVLVDNVSQVIPALMKGRASIAAANLTVTRAREYLVRFGPTYQTVRQQVVYNSESRKAPKKISDLANARIAIPAGTSYVDRLNDLAANVPGLTWVEDVNSNSDELLERVAEGSLDFTIADSHFVAMERNYYPNLGAGLDLGDADDLAWAFRKNGDEWLYQQALIFFARIKQDGTLRSLIDRYYGHSERVKQTDVTGFLVKMKTVLPKYAALFKQAEELTGVDWRMLAAIGYQESHWDPFATSPTNVRGMMMLTEETADRMGVTDRLDPKQSVMAGARYVVMLREMIPERVPEPDRTWLALASYNIGYAHLEDARKLAARLKLNPDAWADVKKTLPLLTQEKYFSAAQYGYARGGAPVHFVESIRTYYRILEKYEQKRSPLLPGFNLVSADFERAAELRP
ncbi:MAG: membrane-bound lytic murein transglycosylase MltF [Methylobacillus sp.]|jgi:membrane-bound lytic murein transglycosylase F|nr:membrane-bound lytic murein transglycosylase MltF [Methylobacillus sp.]